MSDAKDAGGGTSAYEGACPYSEHQSDPEADSKDCVYLDQSESPASPVIPGATPGGGIALNADYKPTPSIVSNANYYPSTEALPVGEMRVSFCGTAPFPPRLKQAGTCIMVELGQGPWIAGGEVTPPRRPKRLFFDLGPGSSRNITALGVPFTEVNDIFFTHLHGDHIAELGYYYCFAPWSARWSPLRVFGPDGEDSVVPTSGDYDTCLVDEGVADDCGDGGTWGLNGVVSMVEGMQKMFHWHADAFKVFPAGDGYKTQVRQFDHRKGMGGEHGDEPGLCHEETLDSGQHIKVYHWPRIHAKSGASAYRLEWTFPHEPERDGVGHHNGDGTGEDNAEGATTTLSFVWTGDGRPNDLTLNYAQNVDVLVTECQTDVPAVMGVKYGFPPELYEYTIDTHHTVHYAVGHVMATCNPRIGMITHAEYDSDMTNELIAGVRYHWNGMFALGAPDGIVVNVTKDAIWYREAVLPDFGPAGTPHPEHMQEYSEYYHSTGEREWKHETPPEQGEEIAVPNPQNKISDILAEEIAQTETVPCRYYPPEVNRPLTVDWPEDTKIGKP